MRQFLILSFLWISSLLSAQKFEYTDYKWADTIAKFTITESELKKPVVYLMDKRVVEIVVDKEGVSAFDLKHTIKKVNTDHGIEKSNKVKIIVQLLKIHIE